MLTYTYVDNSNVFIEGQRIAAVKNGLAKNVVDAMNRRIVDTSWNIDYGKLHEFVCGNRSQVGGAKLWGSPPPGDTFWKMVESKGFKVRTFERSVFTGTEKKVDVAIAHQMTKDAYTLIDKANSEITLVSGDKDFVPVVEDLVQDGFTVIVAFWAHAAVELKGVASRFFDLNPWHDHLAR
jgi:hypothetical protein